MWLGLCRVGEWVIGHQLACCACQPAVDVDAVQRRRHASLLAPCSPRPCFRPRWRPPVIWLQKDLIYPAGRLVIDRHCMPACGFQIGQSLKGVGGDGFFGGQRVVEIGEDADEALRQASLKAFA